MTIRIKIRTLPPPDMLEQALLVYLKLSDDDLGTDEEDGPIEALELELERLVRDGAVGTYDGNEVGGGYYKLFMYGPDADKLFDAVLPTILSFPAAPGSYLVKRYGGPKARARVVQLESTPAIALGDDASSITIESDSGY